MLEVYTEPNYTGEIFVENSGRFKMGQEYYLLQGLFRVDNDSGSVLVKGVSRNPFVITANSQLGRCKRAIIDE